MGKILKLNESDLTRIVKRIIKEQSDDIVNNYYNDIQNIRINIMSELEVIRDILNSVENDENLDDLEKEQLFNDVSDSFREITDFMSEI